jgi:hypothetical protein
MSASLPVYAPDGVERKLLAAGTASIPVAEGLAFTVPAPTVGGSAPFSWTPSTDSIPGGLGYFGDGDLGVTGLVFNQTTSVGGWAFSDFSDLLTLSFPNLVSVDPDNVDSNGFYIAPLNNPTISLVSLFAPVLTTIGGGLEIQSSPTFTSLSVPLLATVGAHVQIELCSTLTSLAFPALVTVVEGFEIIGNSALISLSIPVFIPTNGTSHSFIGNALAVASVNAILVQFASHSGYTSGTIDLTGGTNAAPTDAGATAVTTLTGRGVTVLTN